MGKFYCLADRGSQTEMRQALALALTLARFLFVCLQPAPLLDSVNCSQELGCQLLKGDRVCMPGDAVAVPELDPVLVLTGMKTSIKLRCQEGHDCIPCVQVTLHLGLLDESVKQDGGIAKTGMQPRTHRGSTEEFLRTRILLSARTYPSSRCVAMDVWLPRGHDRHDSTLGSLQFDCFPIALNGVLHVTAFTNPLYRSELKQTHHGPDCSWHKAKDSIGLCQVPSLEVFVGSQEAVVHIWDVPKKHHFVLWLYRKQRNDHKAGLEHHELLPGPNTVSLSLSQVVPCLCLQVWPKHEDSFRTELCPFEKDTDALARAWAQSRLELKVSHETLHCSLKAQCDLLGELVPCWMDEQLACHPLHPQLHLAITVNETQEFPDLKPHPNLCVQADTYCSRDVHSRFAEAYTHMVGKGGFFRPMQLLYFGESSHKVRSQGNISLTSCLQEHSTGSRRPSERHLLLQEIPDYQGNSLLHVMEQGTWVPIAQAVSTGNGILGEALKKDKDLGECREVWHLKDSEAGMLWACSLEKCEYARVSRRRKLDRRTHWPLAWIMPLLIITVILLVLLFKREALKGWLQILNEDYSSGGVLQGRRALILYSPDHAGFELLVSSLASALAQLQLAVSLELWNRGELGSLGPMQWLHAQRRQVLQEGGAVVLLFSRGAVASCAKWLGWEHQGTLTHVNPDSTFLASLNCVLPDFLAGKTSGRYVVACFEDLLPVAEIPALFSLNRNIYPLPSHLFRFLLALAGPNVDRKQRHSLKRHAEQISKKLQQAVQEYQQRKLTCSIQSCCLLNQEGHR